MPRRSILRRERRCQRSQRRYVRAGCRCQRRSQINRQRVSAALREGSSAASDRCENREQPRRSREAPPPCVAGAKRQRREQRVHIAHTVVRRRAMRAAPARCSTLTANTPSRDIHQRRECYIYARRRRIRGSVRAMQQSRQCRQCSLRTLRRRHPRLPRFGRGSSCQRPAKCRIPCTDRSKISRAASRRRSLRQAYGRGDVGATFSSPPSPFRAPRSLIRDACHTRLLIAMFIHTAVNKHEEQRQNAADTASPATHAAEVLLGVSAPRAAAHASLLTCRLLPRHGTPRAQQQAWHRRCALFEKSTKCADAEETCRRHVRTAWKKTFCICK